jgi:DNA-binding NarL/FixJ family response regulator
MTYEDVQGGPVLARGHDQGGSPSPGVLARYIAAKKLTPRQYMFVKYRALGHTFDAAAQLLEMSSSTAERDLRAVHEKLDASCDSDIWRALGWLVVP